MVVDAKITKNIFREIFDRIVSRVLEYCSVGSMDGLYHLTIHGIFHRILWLILFVNSMIGCYFVTVSLFKEREIIILNEQSTVSTYDIPFPSVTICTSAKVDHRILDYNEILNRINNDITNNEEYVCVFF